MNHFEVPTKLVHQFRFSGGERGIRMVFGEVCEPNTETCWHSAVFINREDMKTVIENLQKIYNDTEPKGEV